MPITTALQNQIDAIQARIDATLPTATPEDVVMLAKAVEAVGGQATVFDVIETGETKKAEVVATAEEKSAELVATADAKNTEIVTTGDAQVSRVTQQGDTKVSELQQELEKYALFEGANDTVAGALGMVPAPKAGENAKFLSGDGEWADPISVPIGGFALVPPERLGSDWVIADGGVALLADYPKLAATQDQIRNRLRYIHGGNMLIDSTSHAGPGYQSLNYDPEKGHMVTIGASGIAYSLDCLNITKIERSSSNQLNPVMRNNVLAFYNRTATSPETRYGWTVGELNGETFTELGNAGKEENTQNSYQICAPAGDQLLLNAINSIDSRSEIWRVDTIAKTIQQVTLPIVEGAIYKYPRSRFLRIGNVTFFAAYLSDPTCYRVFCSNDDGISWALAQDAATGEPLDVSGLKGDNYSEGYRNSKHGCYTVDVVAERAVIQKSDGTGGWVSEDGVNWSAYSHLPLGDPKGLTAMDGTWYVWLTDVIYSTQDFTSFSPVTTPGEAFGNHEYKFDRAGWVVPGGIVVAAFDHPSTNSYNMAVVRYSTDGGQTWKVPTNGGNNWSRTSSVNSLDLRYNKDLGYIQVYQNYSSNYYYLYFDAFDLSNHNVPSSFSNQSNGWEIGVGDAFITHNGTYVYQSSARNYNPDTEFRLPTAQSVPSFTINHKTGITLRYAVRAK
jgi:hypothetical protein